MPWPVHPRYLGHPTPRVDGPAKVTGGMKFTTDIALPGLLYGAVLRSRWPAARVTLVDLSAARAAPGIRAAVLVQDGLQRVYYYGQELAAVAGVSRDAVEDALALIQVEAKPLPFVVHETDAIRRDAPRVIDGEPNLSTGTVREIGRPDEAMGEAAVIAEDAYTTAIQLHQCLEPHGNAIAWGETLTAWSSTQGVFDTRRAIAERFGLDESRIRVICQAMGGGFGSKTGLGVEGALCARLSQEAGAPVQLVLSRFEEGLSAGNRPSTFQRIKVAADRAGHLVAFEFDGFGSPGFKAGAATAAGRGGADIPAPYLYRPPHARVRQGNVAINAGSSCAMRAPGNPPASFGIESILDELALRLGMDPVEFRILNDPLDIRRREYRLGAERFGWKAKYRPPGGSPGPVKVGVGCGGASWQGGGRHAEAEVRLRADGTAEVRCGTQDLGTGSWTVAELVAAEMLQLDPARIRVLIGDTRLPPNGTSGGSTTTANIGPAVYDACERAVERLARASGVAEPRGARWQEACRRLGPAGLAARGEWHPGLSSQGVGGVQFAEVEVDVETGFVRVRKVLCVQDCGLVVNPLTCRSQINGGIIMGLGYALYERRVMDATSGVVLNANFEQYKVPGAADTPDIEVILYDMPERGIIGVGEPCTIPTAAAVANAVANAIGARVRDLPITPDRVLAALGAVPNAPPSWSAGRTRA